MSIIRRMRKQKAVWWARNAIPDKFGMFSFASPVEIDCRWDDNVSEIRDKLGQTIMSQATVYPDRILQEGDKLKKDEMESDTPDDPTELTNAFEVQRFEQIPNLRNTETLYIAHLKRG